MDNLGIQNNRFHLKALENRHKHDSHNTSIILSPSIKKRKIGQQEQKKKISRQDSSECTEIFSPCTPHIKQPKCFQIITLNEVFNVQEKKKIQS